MGSDRDDEAAMAAEKACVILRAYAAEPVIALAERCHGNLRSTRGILMSLAGFDTVHNLLTAGDRKCAGSSATAWPTSRRNRRILVASCGRGRQPVAPAASLGSSGRSRGHTDPGHRWSAERIRAARSLLP